MCVSVKTQSSSFISFVLAICTQRQTWNGYFRVWFERTEKKETKIDYYYYPKNVENKMKKKRQLIDWLYPKWNLTLSNLFFSAKIKLIFYRPKKKLKILFIESIHQFFFIFPNKNFASFLFPLEKKPKWTLCKDGQKRKKKIWPK